MSANGLEHPGSVAAQEKIDPRESELSTFFRNLTVLTIAAPFGAASASASIAVEVYTFTGECTDCTGTGTGTLILLADYVLGTPLSADDLYIFNYSSNLIPDLSIHNDPTEVLSGILPVGLGPANISISGENGSFNTSSDGTWSAFDSTRRCRHEWYLEHGFCDSDS